METITISKKDAEALRRGASKGQKKILDKIIGCNKVAHPVKSKDIYDAKSFKDLCAIKGVKQASILPFKKAKGTFQEGLNAFAKLSFIRDTFCNGWEADWNNRDQRKWFPWFEFGSGFAFSLTHYVSWATCTYGGSRLCFENEKTAEHVGRTFIKEYNEFLTK